VIVSDKGFGLRVQDGTGSSTAAPATMCQWLQEHECFSNTCVNGQCQKTNINEGQPCGDKQCSKISVQERACVQDKSSVCPTTSTAMTQGLPPTVISAT